MERERPVRLLGFDWSTLRVLSTDRLPGPGHDVLTLRLQLEGGAQTTIDLNTEDLEALLTALRRGLK
jgi:hypothetical protein